MNKTYACFAFGVLTVLIYTADYIIHPLPDDTLGSPDGPSPISVLPAQASASSTAVLNTVLDNRYIVVPPLRQPNGLSATTE